MIQTHGMGIALCDGAGCRLLRIAERVVVASASLGIATAVDSCLCSWIEESDCLLFRSGVVCLMMTTVEIEWFNIGAS